MTPQVVIDTGQQALLVTSGLLLVLLVPALMVGLLVSVFQAATQINEMTLSFIPKLLVTLGVLIVAGPHLLDVLMNYTTNLIQSIPILID